MRPHDISPDKLRRSINRAIHMRFGGQMDYRGRLIFTEDALHLLGITDIGMLKMVAGSILNGRQTFQMSRVGQPDDIYKPMGPSSDQITHHSRADKPRSACYYYSAFSFTS